MIALNEQEYEKTHLVGQNTISLVRADVHFISLDRASFDNTHENEHLSEVNKVAAQKTVLLRAHLHFYDGSTTAETEESDNWSENEAELVNEREERGGKKECVRQGGCWTLGPRWTWRVRQGFGVGSASAR